MTDQKSAISRRTAIGGLIWIAATVPLASDAAVDLSEFNLVFSDEFNDSNLDSSKWNTGYLWGPYLPINNEEQLYVDEFGTWLTAAVPIKNDQGDVIAVLGLDLDATREVSNIRRLRWICRGAVLVSLGLSGILAVGLARWLGPPIVALQSGAERVRNYDYSTLVSVKNPHELKLLATAFNETSGTVLPKTT